MMTAKARTNSCVSNVGWVEFKPHLRESLEPSPSQQRTASCCARRRHRAQVLTQHRHAGPSANSGSVDTVPEPSGCMPLSLSSCDHRKVALSAAGCECSLPEMAMKTCKKNLQFFFAGLHATKDHGLVRPEREGPVVPEPERLRAGGLSKVRTSGCHSY